MAGYNQDAINYLLSGIGQDSGTSMPGIPQRTAQQKQRLNALNSAARSHGIISKPPTPYNYDDQPIMDFLRMSQPINPMIRRQKDYLNLLKNNAEDAAINSLDATSDFVRGTGRAYDSSTESIYRALNEMPQLKRRF